MNDVDIPFATVVYQSGYADVIFVHGLTGSPAETWTSPDSSEPEGAYWPKWLAADLPHLNFYAVGYPASVFGKWARKEMDLYERSKSCLETMASYEIGSRPIVFIGHSLGGLLIKQMLRTARDSTEEPWQRIAEQCAGVMFLATPHTGSSLATILKAFAGGFTSSHVDALVKDHARLIELNDNFRAACTKKPLTVVAYYEKFKTHNMAMVVDRLSADPGINSASPIAIDASHTSICTPTDRHAAIYTSIRHRLKSIIPPPQISLPPLFGEPDNLAIASPSDRRDLQQKMISAGREHEYSFANLSQNRFARDFERNGLISGMSTRYNQILLDIEQRFQQHVFHPLICNGADAATIAEAVQKHVVDPLSEKYSESAASPTVIMNAIYFLTERCHLRWDKP